MPNLLTEIEKLRALLNEMGLEKRLTDPEVLKLSQQLDTLIHKYYVLA